MVYLTFLRSVFMNNKKIVLETILIPFCILYLYYVLLWNHPKISLVVFSIVIFFTCIENLVKYIPEVYIYESKKNVLKILLIIIDILLIIFLFLFLFLKNSIIKIIFFSLLLILSLYLIYFVCFNIKRIINSKGSILKNTIAAYLSLSSFLIIVMGSIIYFVK